MSPTPERLFDLELTNFQNFLGLSFTDEAGVYVYRNGDNGHNGATAPLHATITATRRCGISR